MQWARVHVVRLATRPWNSLRAAIITNNHNTSKTCNYHRILNGIQRTNKIASAQKHALGVQHFSLAHSMFCVCVLLLLFTPLKAGWLKCGTYYSDFLRIFACFHFGCPNWAYSIGWFITVLSGSGSNAYCPICATIMLSAIRKHCEPPQKCKHSKTIKRRSYTRSSHSIAHFRCWHPALISSIDWEGGSQFSTNLSRSLSSKRLPASDYCESNSLKS